MDKESPLQVLLGDARTEEGSPCWTGVSCDGGDDDGDGDSDDGADGSGSGKEKEKEEREKHNVRL